MIITFVTAGVFINNNNILLVQITNHFGKILRKQDRIIRKVVEDIAATTTLAERIVFVVVDGAKTLAQARSSNGICAGNSDRNKRPVLEAAVAFSQHLAIFKHGEHLACGPRGDDEAGLVEDDTLVEVGDQPAFVAAAHDDDGEGRGVIALGVLDGAGDGDGERNHAGHSAEKNLNHLNVDDERKATDEEGGSGLFMLIGGRRGR